MMRWVSCVLAGALCVTCASSQGKEQSESIGLLMTAAIQNACALETEQEVVLGYFESVYVSGSGVIEKNNSIALPAASPILINMRVRKEQYDCGILWSPCALRISPVVSHGSGTIRVQRISDREAAAAKGAGITVAAPPGSPRIERVNCLQVQ